jgi:hypothetical protein
MRHNIFVGAVIAVVLTTPAGTLRGEPDKETEAQRIARLIQQLGDDEFEKREAASQALEAIGEPARAALRKAAASSDDAEVQKRAEKVIAALRVRAEKRGDIAGWEGTWRKPSGHEMVLKGNEWKYFIDGQFWASGQIKVVELQEKSKVDFVQTGGWAKGRTIKAIVQVRDGTLYLGVSDDDRPKDFKVGDKWTLLQK